MPIPVYSHGGPAMDAFPPVAGTTTNAGNPILINNSLWEPIFQIFFTGTSLTVLIEANGGMIDPVSGLPPSNEWVDYSGALTLSGNGNFSKCLPRAMPCYRTRITAITGAGALMYSYIPAIVNAGGNLLSAGRPSRSSQSYNPNV